MKIIQLILSFLLGTTVAYFCLLPDKNIPHYDSESKFLNNGGYGRLKQFGFPYLKSKEEQSKLLDGLNKLKFNMTANEVISILGRPDNLSIKVDFPVVNSINDYQWIYYLEISEDGKFEKYIHISFDREHLLEIIRPHNISGHKVRDRILYSTIKS